MGDPTHAKSLNTLGIALLVLTGVVLLVMVILIFVSARWARGALEPSLDHPRSGRAARAKLAHLPVLNLPARDITQQTKRAEAAREAACTE